MSPPEPSSERGRVRGLLARGATYGAGLLCVVLAAIAAATQPPAAVFAIAAIATLLIGPLVAASLHQGGPDQGWALGAGAAAAVLTFGLYLVIAGVITVLGAAGALLLALALAAVAAWLWTRRHDLCARARTAADRAGLQARSGAERGNPNQPDDTTRAPKRPSPRARPRPATPVLPAGDSSVVARLSTAALCRAWSDSYWLLQDLPAGPAWEELVTTRALLLDELERRDPTGFALWLDSAPRAGSHPGRHLSHDWSRRQRPG